MLASYLLEFLCIEKSLINTHENFYRSTHLKKESSLQTYDIAVGLIKERSFQKALLTLTSLVEQHVSASSLFEGMKMLSFWKNREDTIDKQNKGQQKAAYLKREWEAFEVFIITKKITLTEVYKLLKKAIYKQIMSELILEIQHSLIHRRRNLN